MKITIVITLFLVVLLCVEGKKTGKSRGSGSGSRSSSRGKTAPQPAPTSFSNPQPSAPKPSLFGWQEKPAQRKTQTQRQQSTPTGSKTHSYPSSQTGLSGGNTQPKQATSSQAQPANNKPSYPAGNGLSGSGGQPPANGMSGNSGHGYPAQESVQRSNAPQQANKPPGSGYPASTGLSGNGGYPPSNGLSGNSPSSGHASGVAPPPYSAAGGAQYPGSGVAPPPYQAAPPPYSGYKPGGNYGTNNYGNNYHPQAPPPAYSNPGAHYGGYGGHGGYGGSGFNGYGSQMPGYFGNRGFGGGSRTSSALKGVGIAGAGVGTLLTGLALWNLARSTGHHHHTVIYDNRGQPVAVAPNNSTEPVVDPILGDLVNCTLTISSPNATEVLGIPCAIATSFTPEADVKEKAQDANADDKTECIVTVVTKAGREFATAIPCSILLRTAAENNVTEPPEVLNNGTDIANESVTLANQPSALMLSGDANGPNNGTLNCTVESGDVRDPINPCFSVTHNLTVIPLNPTVPSDVVNSTPSAA
ncbi:uncharacterized protein LOC134648831 [Cydia amplana]|uniref:uncharacterized protein LOC134648831 n=1 Tax=Cydia amplana TaxID=1869771 RepID=UPI002FE5EE8F